MLIIIDYKFNNNYNITDKYNSMLVIHIAKHFSNKSMITPQPHTILDGTMLQVNELDGYLRGLFYIFI